MDNKIITRSMVVLLIMNMILMVSPVGATITATEVEIRGTVANEGAISGGFNLSNASAGEVNWTVQNFHAFYYDLKDNLGTETLQVLQTDLSSSQRTIDKNNLVYNTSGQSKTLKVVSKGFSNVSDAAANGVERTGSGQGFEDGKYYILGWQGSKYVALNGKINKLSKLLFEHSTASNQKKTLAVGETWDMGDGWTLTPESIDAQADPRQAWLVLSKNGVKVDDKIISEGDAYTYVEKTIAEETDVPLFVTYADSVFAGATSDLVQLRYTWVVSPDVTVLKTGDDIGNLEVTNVNTGGRSLTLKNKDIEIDLDQNAVVDIFGDIKFKVADKSDVLRFYPLKEITEAGSYEVRGTTANDGAITGGFNLSNASAGEVNWTVQNFAAFYYDLKDNLGTETLQILQTDLSSSQRSIDKNNLVYNTSAQSKTLKVVSKGFSNVSDAAANGVERTGSGQGFEDGKYYILGWQGSKYVALNGRINKLSKLLFEHSTASNQKKTLAVGETWDMGDGWTITPESIDAQADPRQAWLVLSKNGVKVDDKIVSEGDAYTYVEKTIAEETDVPLFVTYADSVFAGATSDLVQLRYTWVVSPNVTVLKTGDEFGALEVTNVNTGSKSLTLKNKDNEVDLAQNAVVDIMGEIKIKVADKSDALRFYPKIDYEILEEGAEVELQAENSEEEATPESTVTTPEETVVPDMPVVTTEKGTSKPPETEAPKEPGFELIPAIIGLFAMAHFVHRKRD